jgi:fucose permease
MLALLAALLVAIAFGTAPVVIAAVVASGAVMGINNTLYTEMALEVSDAPRPVASAGYNFVRWFAGVIAPFAAPKIAEAANSEVTFIVAALSALIAIAVLFAGRGSLGRFARPHHEDVASPITASSTP